MEKQYNTSSQWLTIMKMPWHTWRAWQWQKYPAIRLCCAENQLPKFVRQCAVSMEIRKWLQLLDWDYVIEPPKRHQPRTEQVPTATYIAAFLVKIEQEQRSIAALRRFLVRHPALVWGLGFPIKSASTPHGFDVEASLPTREHFSRVLRQMPNDILQRLMDRQVKQLQRMLPEEFGKTISFDTKHILAWVKENNPKAYVKAGRYDKTQQPAGDNDCKLGVKRRFNIKTPAKEGQPANNKGIQLIQSYWGYASGAVVTKLPTIGEFVLAEVTRTFNDGDTRHFFPLMRHVIRRLGFRPTFATADAAFDAFYIYEFFHDPQTKGFAAIPLSSKSKKTRHFNKEGLPICDADLAMPVKKVYNDKTKAICCSKDDGPIFGNGYDLAISNKCNERQKPDLSSYAYLPWSYGDSDKYELNHKMSDAFSGNKNGYCFSVLEYEVYSIEWANDE